jgi:hypothetical protein
MQEFRRFTIIGTRLPYLGQTTAIRWSLNFVSLGISIIFAPASRMADKCALWFLPTALGLSALAWAISGSSRRGSARERGLTLAAPSDVRGQGGTGLSGLLEGKRVVLGALDYVSASATTPGWTRRFLDLAAADEGRSSPLPWRCCWVATIPWRR